MNDRANELKNDTELKFSREQGFFDKSNGVRWLIAAFFMLSLFLFLHFREVPGETLEINTIAPRYIVTQVDFDFLDEEATIIVKQEAVQDIGRIFGISEKEIHKRRTEFEDYISHDQSWRNEKNPISLEELYRGVSALDKVMVATRFSDPRTLLKLEEVGISIENYLIYTPADVAKPQVFPQQIWNTFADEALPNAKITEDARKLILGFFSTKSWIMEEDIPAQRNLRRTVQEAIPDRFTHISAGGRIIDKGDKVTGRNIAMMEAMGKAVGDKRNLGHPLTLLGSFIMTLLLTSICYAYLHVNNPVILHSNRKLFLVVTIVVLTLILSKATEVLLLSTGGNLIEKIRYPVFIPFAAILLASLMNAHIATFACGFLVIVEAMTLSFDTSGFMIINLAAALVTILNIRSLKKRKDIFIVCGKAWICCVLVVFSLNFYNGTFWSIELARDILSTGIYMLLTGVLVVGLLPLFESAFGIMTDVTLMEYMDPNNDLLRRLSIEAPGTYQHSVVVGNLSEAVALSIGANGLFCRVSTLYHDIGKMITPQYFTENQQPGMNIHQLLTPMESAQVIMAHVSEGVSIARKAGLPEQFIDIIKEHHGTTLVYYFYMKQVEKMGGDKSAVDEREFRYAGPKPRSKESVIIMITDTVEAASRSLDTLNEQTVGELATRLIKEKADDGQFDECLLTFEELAIVKHTLVKTLCAFAHSRVKYPQRQKDPTIKARDLYDS